MRRKVFSRIVQTIRVVTRVGFLAGPREQIRFVLAEH